MRSTLPFFLLIAGSTLAQAQSADYVSYRLGAASNKVVQPQGGVCMMGGGTEVDSAMKWFLKRANGGDVLVLRVGDANVYNQYMFTGLGVTLNSVETIVCNNANASNSAYVQQRITEAEAIWFAGEYESAYIDYWRGTPVATLINAGIQNNKLVIGGTSAGMAILGRRYYNPINGSVTASAALANPFVSALTVEDQPFLNVKYLESTITDAHFDNPDRYGRVVAFLARNDFSRDAFLDASSIALDERTAVTIDEGGIARIWGGSATGDDNAYFIRVNCKNIRPETLTAGSPLTWNVGYKALKVYHVKGDKEGTGTFNLATDNIAIPLRSWVDGQQASGGAWEDWYVQGGGLAAQSGALPPGCFPVGVPTGPHVSKITVTPNPATGSVTVSAGSAPLKRGSLLNLMGQVLGEGEPAGGALRFNVGGLPAGVYLLRIVSGEGVSYEQVVRE